jgi:hypothetical protein
MGRALLALPPGDPQPGRKTLEIHWSCRLSGAVQSTAVDPRAKLVLGGTDLSDQLHRMGLRLEPAQCRLALLNDSRMREHPSCRDCRGVI